MLIISIATATTKNTRRFLLQHSHKLSMFFIIIIIIIIIIITINVISRRIYQLILLNLNNHLMFDFIVLMHKSPYYDKK